MHYLSNIGIVTRLALSVVRYSLVWPSYGRGGFCGGVSRVGNGILALKMSLSPEDICPLPRGTMTLRRPTILTWGGGDARMFSDRVVLWKCLPSLGRKQLWWFGTRRIWFDHENDAIWRLDVLCGVDALRQWRGLCIRHYPRIS